MGDPSSFFKLFAEYSLGIEGRRCVLQILWRSIKPSADHDEDNVLATTKAKTTSDLVKVIISADHHKLLNGTVRSMFLTWKLPAGI